MTIETANRLVELRKKNNLSQEELAEKLGVSRQAVSKWERSEASPDTDNLIALAEIYGMSLDELIFGEKRGGADEEEKKDESEEQNHTGKDSVKIGPTGILVKSKGGDEVSISLRGIKVSSGTHDYDDDDFDVEFDDDEDDNEDEEHGIKGRIEVDTSRLTGNVLIDLSYPVICVAAYLIFGFCNLFGGWGLSWIIFLTIPVFQSLVNAITKRRFSKFEYATLIILIYLYCGLYHGAWHPTWVMFLAIPILEGLAKAIDRSKAKKRRKSENSEI